MKVKGPTYPIAVIGAGLMGHGIALTIARAGLDVTITDPVADTLVTVPTRIKDSLSGLSIDDDEIAETLAKIRLCRTIEEAVEMAGFVIEAAPEKLPLKQAIFCGHRSACTKGRGSRLQHVGHSDHQDYGRAEPPRASARYPLVEPASYDPTGRGNQNRVDRW